MRVTVIRQGFLLRLKPGAAAEYRRLHENVPNRVESDEEDAGVVQETIFIRGDDLFVFSVIRDEGTWDRARGSEASRAWAATLEPYLEMDEQGQVLSTPLEEVYHHETGTKLSDD